MKMKKAEDLEERIGAFEALEKANEGALRSFSRIRENFEEKRTNKLITSYASLIEDIHKMILNYGKLGKGYNSCCIKFSELDEETWSELDEANFQMFIDGDAKIDLYNCLEEITLKENGEADHNSLENCKTLHDLVRFLHSGSLNALFEGPSGAEEDTIKVGGNRFHVIGTKKGKYPDVLDTIIQTYKQRYDMINAGNEYKIIMTKGRLMGRVQLGCHLSIINVGIKENDLSSIEIKFVNTPEDNYKNAPYRAQYVEQVLQRIGFSYVKTLDTITHGRSRNLGKKDLLHQLSEVTKMLVSTKDLDTSGSKIKGRVNDAVKAFFNGEISINKYLDATS